jgi:hypothetical protein
MAFHQLQGLVMTNAQKSELLRVLADALANTPDDPLDEKMLAQSRLRGAIKKCLAGTTKTAYLARIERSLLPSRKPLDKGRFEELIKYFSEEDDEDLPNLDEFIKHWGYKGVMTY